MAKNWDPCSGVGKALGRGEYERTTGWRLPALGQLLAAPTAAERSARLGRRSCTQQFGSVCTTSPPVASEQSWQNVAAPDCIILNVVPRIADMPMRTTAVEAATARGWSRGELARRTGLSRSTIHNLESGEYDTISGKTIGALMQAFPDLPYERLFVPIDSRKKNAANTSREMVA